MFLLKKYDVSYCVVLGYAVNVVCVITSLD